jgi:hypothetical protein
MMNPHLIHQIKFLTKLSTKSQTLGVLGRLFFAVLVLTGMSSFGASPGLIVGRDVEIKEVGPGTSSPTGLSTGKSAAAKYLSSPSAGDRIVGDNFLSIMAGPYINSASYAWKGSDKRTGIAKATYNVTYLFERWHNIDVNIRGDFTEFQLDDEKFLKMSLMPLWTLPMADTRFPLYFGFGAGLGVFFRQVDGESNLSLDYQLLTGLRFPDLFENVGPILEFGMKNHLHILSDGQVNATALTIGAIFSF